jgi:hypothetical protein
VLRSVRAHVEKEIDLALQYEFRFNRDLMDINSNEEEGLLFEITDKSKVECDAKERILSAFVDRERELIREIFP